MEELKNAQTFLRENVLRSFWRRMTKSSPNICVDEGISIDFSRPLSKRKLFEIVERLTKCAGRKMIVATPLYQYNFEPDNTNPHHVSAITLRQNGSGKNSFYTLNMFNPKGKDSLRKEQEKIFLTLLQKLLEVKLQAPVKIHQYLGQNLQRNDSIGLCQLYSLMYLYEFTKTPQNTDPEKFVRFIRTKNGSYDKKTLLKFWCDSFGQCKK